jgi:hypothetical protein
VPHLCLTSAVSPPLPHLSSQPTSAHSQPHAPDDSGVMLTSDEDHAAPDDSGVMVSTDEEDQLAALPQAGTVKTLPPTRTDYR